MIAFTVSCDDMYGLELVCDACPVRDDDLHNLLNLPHSPDGSYAVPLDRLNELAAEHVRASHA